MNSQVLNGIRVLDFTSGMAGPLATMVLADYGAEVVRVEPVCGDPWWSHPAYLVWNRGKKSIELDLSVSSARARLAELIKGTDILVEGFSPGMAEELGISYDVASEINSSLIYCSLSAFGQEGPYKDLKAYDGIINAKSGRMRDQVGWQQSELRPTYRAVNDVSFHTAMFAIQGILAALHVVSTSGRGQRVSTSLLEGTTAPNNPWRRFEGEQLPPDRYPGEVSPEQVLRGELVADRKETDPYKAIPSQLCTVCKDGKWIMHSHIQLGLFKAWIKAIGFDWIWDDERFQGAPHSYPDDDYRIELNLMIVDRMKDKTSDEWMEVYSANPDVAGEVMRTTQEAIHHPQYVERGLLIETEDPRVGTIAQLGPIAYMSETPAVVKDSAPIPGANTEEILATPRTPRATPETSSAAPERPLEGVVMVELASWLAAPWAGALMADLGARVIKVESLTGDPYRALTTNEQMIRCGQGKESIAVNLKSEDGKKILYGLVEKADVVMHNYRPGVPERIGVDYDALKTVNPDLVYVYASAYGSTGPYSRRAAFNPTIGAFSGNSVFQSGEGNDPIGDQSPDPISGSGVATAIMLGLTARARTGKGQYVETTMMNTVIYCNSDDAFSFVGKPPRRVPDEKQLGLQATYRLYEAKEGWVFLAAPWDDEFSKVCGTAGCKDLLDDERFASVASRYEHRAELGKLLETVFLERTADQWESELGAAGVGCVRADAVGHKRFLHEDPHTQAVGFMVPTAHPLFASEAPDGKYWRHSPVVEFSDTPCEEGKSFTDLGEHTVRILQELGYSKAEVGQLKEDDVVGWAAS